jgi:L,D-transpeptidase ErfK/SrfK
MSNTQLDLYKCKRWLITLALFLQLLAADAVFAQRFDLPTDNSTIVGKAKIVVPKGRNTLLDIARHFDLGYHEITWANPDVDEWVPEPTGGVVIPSQFILPPKPWTGIVVNISQRRLYYFPTPAKGEKPAVFTYPISIAREGWSTPLGITKVVGKHKDPAWFVPKSIQAEHKAQGEVEFPEYFPPGPDNPMGMLALALGFPAIFIHGTNHPWGVGMRTSHGCLHLYPEDAVALFGMIQTGTPVRVIDEPVMVGMLNNQLYVTQYEEVKEYGTTQNRMTRATLALTPYLMGSIQPKADPASHVPAPPEFEVDWNRVAQALKNFQVLPISISPKGETPQELVDALIPEYYQEEPFGAEANNAKPPERKPPVAAQVAEERK